MDRDQLLGYLQKALHRIIDDWFQRVRLNFVTEEDARELSIEPEIKRFHEPTRHRIKFARAGELDVTYGLGVISKNDGLYIESSVNNKSEGFDFDAFVRRLQAHYWSSRSDKPWLEPDFDKFAYQDLLPFEPVMGQTVILDSHPDKADIIRLNFRVDDRCSELLPDREDLLCDLLDNYCLGPLRRIYAEAYRERSN